MRYLLILILFSGCYSLNKAKVAHAKAVTTFPEIGAEFCAITYPVRSVVTSDTVTTTDTLWGAGEIHFDTVYSRLRDTVYITRFAPGNVIRETVTIRDTVVKENTAALKAVQLDNSKLTGLLETTMEQYDKWRAIAKTRWWIMIGLGAIIGLGLFLKLRKSFAGLKTTD